MTRSTDVCLCNVLLWCFVRCARNLYRDVSVEADVRVHTVQYVQGVSSFRLRAAHCNPALASVTERNQVRRRSVMLNKSLCLLSDGRHHFTLWVINSPPHVNMCGGTWGEACRFGVERRHIHADTHTFFHIHDSQPGSLLYLNTCIQTSKRGGRKGINIVMRKWCPLGA